MLINEKIFRKKFSWFYNVTYSLNCYKNEWVEFLIFENNVKVEMNQKNNPMSLKHWTINHTWQPNKNKRYITPRSVSLYVSRINYCLNFGLYWSKSVPRLSWSEPLSRFTVNVIKWSEKILKAVGEAPTMVGCYPNKLWRTHSPRCSIHAITEVVCIKRTKQMELGSIHWRNYGCVVNLGT